MPLDETTYCINMSDIDEVKKLLEPVLTGNADSAGISIFVCACGFFCFVLGFFQFFQGHSRRVKEKGKTLPV